MNAHVRVLGELDRLIHEPARLMLVALLSSVESADFTYLANETGLTRGNLSQHLTKLEEGHYVTIVKRFRGKYPQTLVQLTANGRQAFEDYRKAVKKVLVADADRG